MGKLQYSFKLDSPKKLLLNMLKATTWTNAFIGILLIIFSASPSSTIQAQDYDVILQGFYWNTHPGDHSDDLNGGIWWDTLATVAPQVADAGFSTVWTPPMTKGFGGRWDMGYGLYDYYDLGEYNQKFSIRTRHGNRAQFDAMMTSMHAEGLNVMADIVLNHRGGADGQQDYEVPWGAPTDPTPWTLFNPASGRFPGVPGHYHPSSAHPDQNPDYHSAIFFEDICYFNDNNMMGPPGGWYFGNPPYGLGHAADSLIAWGRWLMNDIGFDEMRLDAVKHIDPAFLAKFLVEVNNGSQPFAVGEFFDFNGANLASYQGLVESNANSGSKPAEMAIFDFEMRAQMKSILDNTSGSGDMYNVIGKGGMVWSDGASGFDVVTFLDNHDKDRVGFIGGSAQNPDGTCPAGEIVAGNSCVKLDGYTASDHDPVINDKEDMGYPLMMAMEGRPTVFWKDFFWFGIGDEITWAMTLRSYTARGGSSNSSLQNEDGDGGSNDPYWDPAFGSNCHGGNMFAMQRWGLSGGTSDGMVLGLNDHPTDELGMYVNTPFSQKTLKDYSDGYMFVTVNAPADSRTLIRCQPRDYTWWSLTGLYPTPPGEDAAAFTLDAQPGGQVQYVVIDQDDAANLMVNGQPIARGDQLAITDGSNNVYGIGRVGQGYGWKPGYDMVIEVLGAFPDGTPNGMPNGSTLNLAVFDASSGQYFTAGTVTFAPNSTAGTFNALRPETPNRPASFALSTTTGTSTYSIGSIARITQFDASTPTGAFPVEWLSFEVFVEKQAANLVWSVGSEIQNEGFGIEIKPYREDAFEEIAFTAGAGNHDAEVQYEYRLTDLDPGKYEVRLRQVDLDGSINYSRVEQFEVVANGSGISVTPNPNEGAFQLRLNAGEPGPIAISLIDASGRTVYQESLKVERAGEVKFEVGLPHIPAGIYLLKVRNGSATELSRIRIK